MDNPPVSLQLPTIRRPSCITAGTLCRRRGGPGSQKKAEQRTYGTFSAHREFLRREDGPLEPVNLSRRLPATKVALTRMFLFWRLQPVS
jgi:hypothetical protein